MLYQNNTIIEAKDQEEARRKLEENAKPFEYYVPVAGENPICKCCNTRTDKNGRLSCKLFDVPIIPTQTQYLIVYYQRYRCPSCGKSTNNVPSLRAHNVRATWRLSLFIKMFLAFNISIKHIAKYLGIHWSVVRKLHEEEIDLALGKYDAKLKDKGYKPQFLAVDEFALFKGHRYATTVMDLDTGVLHWVGTGRSIADFERFYDEIDPDFISQVIAVAMDMNTAYNKVVQRHTPQAAIVYDRFHMQAQYGREVMGVVRLDQVRQHRNTAKLLEEENENKERIRQEKYEASKLKSARWILLKSNESLKGYQGVDLREILSKYADISTCYALKEEIGELYRLRDTHLSKVRWVSWFEAARASGIEPLVKFANNKLKRLDGLVAHALYPISTGPLEGLNNKIKLAKRIGYGFRNHRYFFKLLRYLTLPEVRAVLHTKT